MHYNYKTIGVCSETIEFDLENDTVHNVRFYGGCNGNLQGIARLVEGMTVKELVSHLKGIRCGGKSTSCPDQLAHAVQMAQNKK